MKQIWQLGNMCTKMSRVLLLIAVLYPSLAYSQHEEREPVVLSKTCLYYGLQAKEGVNLFFSQKREKQGITVVGYQFKPFFSVFAEIGNLYSHDDVFNGVGVELQYAQRGGKITKYMTYPPAYLTLDYIDVRPYFVYHSKELNFMRMGVDFSFLQKSVYVDSRNVELNDDEHVTKKDLGIWIEAGGTIGKHFTLSFFADWLFWGYGQENDDLLTDDYWGVPTDDHNLTIGMTLGILFNPIKIKTNKF